MKVKIKECPQCKAKDVACERLYVYPKERTKGRFKCAVCKKEFDRTLADATTNGDEVVEGE